MANQELIKFIGDETAAGHTEAEIRAGLKGKGWADSDIDMAWSAWRAGTPEAVVPQMQAAAGGGEVGRFIQPSWELLNQMVPTIVELYKSFAVPFVILFAILFGYGFYAGTGDTASAAASFGSLGVMLVVIIPFVYYAMWIQATLILVLHSRGGTETVSQLKDKALPFIGSLFWSNFLYGLLIGLGFIALIIPGIILLVRYSVVQNVVMDQGKRGMAALNASRDYVVGQWWPVFYSVLGLLAINILAAIVLNAISSITGDFIGGIIQLAANLVLFPYSTIYTYMLYERLKAMRPEVAGMHVTAPATASQPPPVAPPPTAPPTDTPPAQ